MGLVKRAVNGDLGFLAAVTLFEKEFTWLGPGNT